MARRTRYLWGIGLTVGALLIAAIAFNAIIDPYDYFGSPRIAGLNAVKPSPGTELVAVKEVALSRLAPSALILGNSRAEVGFDPEHPAWAIRRLTAYNAAVRGAGLATIVRMLETARRTREPEVVVLGLDFLDFLTEPDSKIGAFPTVPPEGFGARVQRWLGAVGTVRGLRDSILTILAQHERFPETITDRGLNPLLEYQGIARAEGYHAMFRQRAQENARTYVRKPSDIFVSGTRTSTAFEIVKGLVEGARQRGTELHLVIYPYHAQILVMFEAAGLWPAFEQWKRRLAEIGAEGGPGITLWDFSGFSDYSTEAIPGPGDTTTEVRWYWEAGHYKKVLGDVVLERVLMPKAADGAERFGIRLTTENVDDHLFKDRQERDAFRVSNASFVAATESLVQRVR